MTWLFGILWAASTCLLPVCLLYYLISILKQISVEEFMEYDSVVVFLSAARAYIAKFFVTSH